MSLTLYRALWARSVRHRTFYAISSANRHVVRSSLQQTFIEAKSSDAAEACGRTRAPELNNSTHSVPQHAFPSLRGGLFL